MNTPDCGGAASNLIETGNQLRNRTETTIQPCGPKVFPYFG